MRMVVGSMGCGGSRSATIEPRYYESRDTESTWLTNTDTEITQLPVAGNSHKPNGTSESPTEKENTTATASERKLVNAGTQCGRHSTLTSSNQRRPVPRDEVKNKSKKIPADEVVKSVRPAVNKKMS
ncbi:BAALC binder of MAP3K1 and KLF4 a isoform X2 [Myxocyprinus asiaticus]|uniref:BAALC binder of MAP3K1 and KLF4 a isoform X2 n=1 Tax=Myxocyprinus asiaticus TaxID=70543 RepID=UPI002223ED82|nr:BAALC binder of MAP3K1 and KLF4 a isoform X2 [Myxocyprinus asiaticus]